MCNLEKLVKDNIYMYIYIRTHDAATAMLHWKHAEETCSVVVSAKNKHFASKAFPHVLLRFQNSF